MNGGFTRQGTHFNCLSLSAAGLPSIGTLNPVKRRFLSAAAEAIIPALLLAALIILHPVSIDLAVERFFAPDGTFPLQNSAALLFFHKWAKLLTVFVALGVIAIAVKDRAKISPRISVTEAGYLITAILVCVGTVSVLKDMTGVYCPVSTTFFGGTHPILAPHFGFSLSAPGNCWPGGFAGTGFSLIPFWFAFRRRRPTLARAGLFFAILFGTVCGVIQMMRGYHFPSHNVATFLLDWSLSALVYLAFLASSLKRSHAARFIRIPQKA